MQGHIGDVPNVEILLVNKKGKKHERDSAIYN
jgi:hypothetical protein